MKHYRMAGMTDCYRLQSVMSLKLWGTFADVGWFTNTREQPRCLLSCRELRFSHSLCWLASIVFPPPPPLTALSVKASAPCARLNHVQHSESTVAH